MQGNEYLPRRHSAGEQFQKRDKRPQPILARLYTDRHALFERERVPVVSWLSFSSPGMGYRDIKPHSAMKITVQMPTSMSRPRMRGLVMAEGLLDGGAGYLDPPV